MWIYGFCLGGYLSLLIVLCVFVRKCEDLRHDVEDLKDKLFMMEVFGNDPGSDLDRRGSVFYLQDSEDPEVRQHGSCNRRREDR